MDFFKLIGDFQAVLNFNLLFIKLNVPVHWILSLFFICKNSEGYGYLMVFLFS